MIGYDEAIIGLCSRTGVTIYSQKKIVDILCKDSSYEDALGWFYSKMATAYYGERTPIIVEDLYEYV